MVRRSFLAVLLASPLYVAAQNSSHNYYLYRGTTLPRAVSSDPFGPRPDGDKLSGSAFEGSTANMSREGKRSYDLRAQSELKAYRAGGGENDAPQLKLNIPPREMPALVTE
ncbi:hypothetical protein [Paraburkholderia sp.]|uniref:hypothetical protein n=1 Tax=Paraburkholderia sp. TaxID=1926495 RepID=UPI002F3E95FD